jgi:hypothetical protein
MSTFVDQLGDQWVAKGAVDSGKWHRATDAFACIYHRTGAWTLSSTANQRWDWDTVYKDTYALASASPFTTPCAGRWRIRATLGVNFTAAGQTLSVGLTVGGNVRTNAQIIVGSASTTADCSVEWEENVALGTALGVVCSGTNGLSGRVAAFGVATCVVIIEYMGISL